MRPLWSMMWISPGSDGGEFVEFNSTAKGGAGIMSHLLSVRLPLSWHPGQVHSR